jgi:hypothetical protein
MGTDDLIILREFCAFHEIEVSFVQSLNEYGLVEVLLIEETHFIPREQVKNIEKMIRLHYELEINLEGIDVIFRLLDRVDDLQQEVNSLKNRLHPPHSEDL